MPDHAKEHNRNLRIIAILWVLTLLTLINVWMCSCVTPDRKHEDYGYLATPADLEHYFPRGSALNPVHCEGD